MQDIDIQISVRNLTKIYPLYSGRKARLKEAFGFKNKKYHDEFYALNDVSIDVKKGECVGIIGKNGAGKSTLLKILTGVLTPTSGTVELKGRVSALLELGAGFNPEYSGVENIYLSGAIMGYTREEMKYRIQDIIDFAAIGEFVHQPVKMYSSGMYVRLAFAVAINVEPDILIVDEALSVGDAAFQAKCISKMQKIMESGATVLFVTHDTNTVKRFCERCVYLENGRVKQTGPAEDIADLYLRNIREDMNHEHIKIAKDIKKGSTNPEDYLVVRTSVQKEYNEIKAEFDKKVAANREGTGAIQVHNAELFDKSGNPIAVAEYNQFVTLRLTIEFYEKTAAHVAYHFRNSKNMEIAGSSTLREGREGISGKPGDRYIIEFDTKLPFMEGAYNLTTVVSQPVIMNRTALFLDHIENALIFEVLEAPVKLWDQVYIKNDIRVLRLED